MTRALYLLPLLLVLLFGSLAAQDIPRLPGIEFVSPLPDARLVSPATGLTLRGTTAIRITSAADVTITGSVTGTHSWGAELALDGQTWRITPDRAFAEGEHVTVQLALHCSPTGLPLSWQFQVSNFRPPVETPTMLRELLDYAESHPPAEEGSEKLDVESRPAASPDLPSDFPNLSIVGGDIPGDEVFFLAPFDIGAGNAGPYLLIIRPDGEPVYYRRLNATAFDFKVQPNGNLTWYDNHEASGQYVEYDSTYTLVDRWTMGNGYGTDLHELVLLQEGGALMMAYDFQTLDMSEIVDGGNPTAQVVGLIIQEQDADHNVVFEWRSWDHFEITDAEGLIDLTAGFVDYVHGNSIERDVDGNLLISSRHLDEITKIDRQTGEVIWRWGGNNNDFEYIGDYEPFSHQHDVRRLPNGNVLMFDNGNGHQPQYSRAVEYRIDEVAMTAEQVWEWTGDPTRFSIAMGSARRYDDGSTLIGWGLPTEQRPRRTATLVVGDTTAWELTMGPRTVNYRAFRGTWSGTSRAPELYSEDAVIEKVDTFRLSMAMFGDVDPDGYVIYHNVFEDGWQFDSIGVAGVDGRFVARNLRRGSRHRFQAAAILKDGSLTPLSEILHFQTWPVGPVIRTGEAINLGTIGIGQVIERRLEPLIRNDGEENLRIDEIRVTGNDSAWFSLPDLPGLPIVLPPDSGISLTLRFANAVAARRHTASIVIGSNAVNNPLQSIPLSTTVARNVATIAPESVEFGTLDVGEFRDTLLASAVCNGGTTPFTVTELAVEGNGFDVFPGVSLPYELSPDSCFDFSVRFSPSDTGLVEGRVTIRLTTGEDAGSILLSGRGDQIGSVGGESRSRLALTLTPNPSAGRVTLTITAPGTGEVECEIVNLRGETVLRWTDRPAPHGRSIEWNGRDAAGNPVPNGVYYVVIRQGAERRESTIRIVR